MKHKLLPARMAEMVADAIRRRILAGDYSEAGLPKEEELREQFGVAKSSMREALLILKTEGLITVRRGNIGGSHVHVPTIETAGYALGLGLAAASTTLGDIAATLQILEPQCAALCALREDRMDQLVPHLEKINAQYEDSIDQGTEAIRLSRQFHESLVNGCGNTAFSFLTATISRLWSAHELAWATERTLSGTFPSLEQRRHSLVWHRQISRAIADGDAGVSETLREHLIEAQSILLAGHADKPIDVADLRITNA